MTRSVAVFALALLFSVSAAQQYVPERSAGNEEPVLPMDDEPESSVRDKIESLKSAAQQRSAHGSARDAERQEAYDRWVDDYKQGAYSWHQTSTIIIFFVVIFVVISGVLLAAWQLHAWISRVRAYDRVILEHLRNAKAIDSTLINEIGEAPGGEVRLQSKSLAISSPYVGVLILGLSMGFFLAYLLLVYPIIQGP